MEWSKTEFTYIHRLIRAANRHAGMRQSGGYYPQWLRSNQSGRKLCRIVWTCKPDSDHYGPASEYNGDAGKYRNVLGHGNGIGTDQLPVAKELSENRRGTSATYTAPATCATDNASTFDVVVSNSAGSITSNSATLSVSILFRLRQVTMSPQMAATARRVPSPARLPRCIALNSQWSNPPSR